ncbi:hypothetical protein B0H19DRAFT_1265371 [Mycena capillaripes]|nr:hypothetical protein B0H19DRAFT_1265371 [Mycena capillaripes]
MARTQLSQGFQSLCASSPAPQPPPLHLPTRVLGPLPLVEALSNLQPALSTTMLKPTRAPPAHRPESAHSLRRPSARKPLTPAHAEDLQMHGISTMQNDRVYLPHLLDLLRRYTTHRAHLPGSPAHLLRQL